MERLKVVLIDDERVVLNGIKMILKRQPDLELVGAADNGLDGLRTVLEERPQIVLTDIRMPGMSGLELIQKAKETLPDTIYIIFSGYNEFQYVKEAIGLGVVDYIEKPVDKAKLRQAVDKGIQMYNYRQSYNQMSQDMKKARKARVERLLREIYEQPWDEERKMKELLADRPELADAVSLCVVKIAGKMEKSIEEYRQIIQQMAFEVIRESRVDVYSFYEYENLVLTYFSYERQRFPFAEAIKSAKEQLEASGVECFVGMSRVHTDFGEVRGAFVEADDAVRYALYLEEKDAVNIDEVEYAQSIPRDLRKDENSIGFNFRLGQYDACRAQVGEYLQYLRQAELLPELLQQKCMELLFMLKRLRDEAGRPGGHEIDLVYRPEKYGTSADARIRWAMAQADKMLDSALSDGRTEKNRAVSFARDYIEQHYHEGLTLDAIAEQLHMNTTYLSMLFKKEEGITYIKYLTNVRMEKAMEYIRQGHKAKEVCEKVGYYDYKHFSAQFKSYTGMTLDVYKKRFLGVDADGSGR